MIPAVSITRISKSLFIIGSVLLHACGGGGGGGGGDNSGVGSSSGNGPNQPPVIEELVIDNSNATDVLTIAGPTYEAFFELASLGIVSIDLANRYVTQWQGIGCDKNGTFSVSLVDRDSNQLVSAGDSVVFTYSQCDMRVVGGEVSGTLSIDITSFSGSNSAADWAFVGMANIHALINTAGEPRAEISGPYRIEYQKNAQGDSTKALSTTNPLSVNLTENGESFTDTYTNVSITKSYDTNTSKYSVSGGFYVAFDFDEVQCNTINSLEGTQLYLPDAGLIECRGANNTAVRGGPEPITNYIYSWFVDLNSGSGAFSRINSVMVSGDYDGALFTPTLLDQPYGAGAGSNLLSNIQIISYAASVVGKVYVVTGSAAPTLPKRLIEIDPLTGGRYVRFCSPKNLPH